MLACWVREECSRRVRRWPGDRFVSQVLLLEVHLCVCLVLWGLWHQVHSARHRAGVIKSSYGSKWLKEKGRLNLSLENLFYSIPVSAKNTNCLKPSSVSWAFSAVSCSQKTVSTAWLNAICDHHIKICSFSLFFPHWEEKTRGCWDYFTLPWPLEPQAFVIRMSFQEPYI